MITYNLHSEKDIKSNSETNVKSLLHFSTNAFYVWLECDRKVAHVCQ